MKLDETLYLIQLKKNKEYLAKQLTLAHQMLDAYKWLDIETAPKGKPGFLATDEEMTEIEWLIDYDGEKFLNQNSGNYTNKKHWKYWMPLPEPPEK